MRFAREVVQQCVNEVRTLPYGPQQQKRMNCTFPLEWG